MVGRIVQCDGEHPELEMLVPMAPDAKGRLDVRYLGQMLKSAGRALCRIADRVDGKPTAAELAEQEYARLKAAG